MYPGLEGTVMEGEMDGGLTVGTVGRKYADWGHIREVWFGIPQNEIVIFVKLFYRYRLLMFLNLNHNLNIN